MSKFIPQYEPRIRPKDIRAVVKQMKSGWVGPSQTTLGLESILKNICGVQECISTTSGTMAIMMALHAMYLSPGSTILFPAYTFIAGANAARLMGFKVKLVDIKQDTLCMDPGQVVITPDVSCVIFVNHNGYRGADVKKIKDICQNASVLMIEDSSQALGMTNTLTGDVGIISFSVPKVVTTGQGGVVLTNNKKIAELCREFRDHGDNWRKTRTHEKIGGNFKFNDILASYGLSQLQDLNEILDKRKDIFDWYREYLRIIDFGYDSTWMVIYRTVKADLLIEALKTKGIQTVKYYRPIHKNPPYKTDYKFPVADEISEELVYLPSSLILKRKDIKKICRIINEVEDG